MTRRPLAPALLLLVLALPALAAGFKDPVAFVQALYMLPDRWFTASQDAPSRLKFLSPALAKLVTDNKKLDPESQLAYDAFADGQDADISGLKVTLVSTAGTKAAVRAEFKNFDTRENLTFLLVSVAGEWRLDDIKYDEDRSLADDLQFLNTN